VRLTIERLRALVLASGVLLVVALAAFLVIGKWRNPFNRRDIPQRLGIEIRQEANGVTYTQARGGRTLFKLHASKVVQLKKGNALLHDVKIELYGLDGNRADSIEGAEFEYDQQAGMARAAGPVEITLMRPGAALAIAPKAAAAKPKGRPLAAAAQTAASGQIHVRTSGLTFDQKSGVATTTQRVDFTLTQGNGSAVGATYDSQHGVLVLDHAVELNTRRGTQPVALHAQHAEFERGDRICRLRDATAENNGGKTTAGEATIVFREDGSAERLDAASGFALVTAAGGHLAAPTGTLDFDEHNQPRHGRLEGGVVMDSVKTGEPEHEDRQMHGTAPAVELDFTTQGQLRHAHLENGVAMDSEERSGTGAGRLQVRRHWRSPVADVEFREAGKGRMEPAAIEGTGGVVVTGESQRGDEPALPSRLAADKLTAQLGRRSLLSTVIGLGHASMEQTTATGARQTTSGDRLEVHFASAGAGSRPGAKSGQGAAAQIRSAEIEGNVVLVQHPVAKAGAQPEAPMRATAGKADYEGTGEWLHLTESPRVEDGELQLTANKIDVSQDSGDAFAHGKVKASWVRPENGKGAKQPGVVLGGEGTAHVVAAEAQLHQPAGEATFRGQVRLWQDSNSVSAPVIVLDRVKETLVARSTNPAEPVRVVLVSDSAAEAGAEQRKPGGKGAAGLPGAPAVTRMRGGDLRYSAAERNAVMRGGALGQVVAETGMATSDSDEVELTLLPPGNHAGKNGGPAQVDRMVARGRVAISSQGRRGTGEKLVYTGETGEYVLTGTAGAPPKMTDPTRGTVTGETLIFDSRDDSVRVEGGGRETRTETTAPR
jgi:lipopolysaccharide export system protein LptA